MFDWRRWQTRLRRKSTLARPRLLFFSHETTWSGAPIQLLHLIRWFHESGWPIGVAVPALTTLEAGPITAELVQAGIEIFPILDLSQPPDLTALAALARRYDVVIANTLVMWAAVQAARNENVATIWYIHESRVAEHLVRQVAEIEPTFALADLLVMPTERTAALYRQWTKRPIEVVPYGIPAVRPNEPCARNEPAKCHFLLLGSFEHRKGQDVLIGAIKRLPFSLQGQAVFRLAGRVLDERYLEEIERAAADVPNVELLPALEHEEALASLAASDVLVCTSRDETLPVAILEAMSLGKTIVTANVGGITEWLAHGKNSLLFPAEDISALSDALTRCVREPRLRRSLGKAGRKLFQKNFSLDRLGQRFTALI
ncbi:MAG TPA: glycosyltransferase family 4 protein, partial [Chthoniobacterales bacterium]|nr:glycosyltransferase family 4 protein [Chthoniobacterales bacterium]